MTAAMAVAVAMTAAEAVAEHFRAGNALTTPLVAS